ncbi:hypothetical protein Btru_048741 [Bulinus truncatus]|nr:hypothetical protein Btru_048741 [Bulinus truncatus]
MSSNATFSPQLSPVVLMDASTANINLAVVSQVDILLNCFLLHFLSLLGIISNIFNIIVLSKHSFQETTNILLLSLSVCDLMCSILQPIRKIHCFAERFNPVLGLTLKSLSSAHFFVLPDIFVSASILHTTLIAVERLVAVCFPLRVSRIFTPSRVKRTVLFFYVYAFGMLSPTMFLSEFTWIYDAHLNATRGSLVPTNFYLSNYITLSQYATLVTPHLFATCPLFIIITCSAVTGFKLTVGRHRALANMACSVSSSKQSKDIRVVKMLLTVCVVNASVAVPTVVINLFLQYSNFLIVPPATFTYVMRSVINVVYQFMVTVNFVIYVTMSSKFAKSLNQLLCSKANTLPWTPLGSQAISHPWGPSPVHGDPSPIHGAHLRSIRTHLPSMGSISSQWGLISHPWVSSPSPSPQSMGAHLRSIRTHLPSMGPISSPWGPIPHPWGPSPVDKDPSPIHGAHLQSMGTHLPSMGLISSPSPVNRDSSPIHGAHLKPISSQWGLISRPRGSSQAHLQSMGTHPWGSSQVHLQSMGTHLPSMGTDIKKKQLSPYTDNNSKPQIMQFKFRFFIFFFNF